MAALFAVHPMHVESVAWVAERKDLLSTFLELLTIAAYLWYVRCMKKTADQPLSERLALGVAWYVPVFVLFALTLMAKPMPLTLPFLLLLLDYWPLGRLTLRTVPERTRRRGEGARKNPPSGPEAGRPSPGSIGSRSSSRGSGDWRRRCG